MIGSRLAMGDSAEAGLGASPQREKQNDQALAGVMPRYVSFLYIAAFPDAIMESSRTPGGSLRQVVAKSGTASKVSDPKLVVPQPKPNVFEPIVELIQPRWHRISRLGPAPPGFCCSPRRPRTDGTRESSAAQGRFAGSIRTRRTVPVFVSRNLPDGRPAGRCLDRLRA